MYNLDRLKREEIKKLSFKDIFLSDEYKEDLQSISDTAVSRTGYEAVPPTVRVIYDTENDCGAYTDGKTITINFGSSFGKRLEVNPVAYHISTVGVLAHELAHVFYTDFDDGLKYQEEALKGSIYPEKPNHPNADELEKALGNKSYRGFFSELMHSIDNTLEDVYVNQMQTVHLGGLYAKGIALRNTLISQESMTVKEQKENDFFELAILLNLLLCNLKAGVVYYGEYENEYKARIDKLTDIAMQYVYSHDHTDRCRGCNMLICELWNEVEELLKDADNQQQQQQDGQGGQDGSGNEQQGDSSGSGGSNSSGGSQSQGSGSEQGENSDSSDENGDGEQNGGSQSSCGNGKDLSEILDDLLKQAKSQIEGQTEETKNGKTSGKAEQMKQSGGSCDSTNSSDLSSLSELADPPRFKQCAGEAIATAGNDLSGDELEALRRLAKIADEIRQSKAENHIECDIKRELSEIDSENLTGIHKNVKFTVNRPEIKSANKIAYNKIVSNHEKVIDALVKVVKREIKAENLSGERRGRLYGKMLNTSALYRTDLKIFKDRRRPEKVLDLAVSLLIDESGSMLGSRIEAARNTAILLAEVFEQLNVAYEVFGHTASSGAVSLNNYKNFDSPKKDDKYRLAQIRTFACNRDGAAILYSTERLKKRPEKSKLFIIISDGQPNDVGYGGNKAKSDLKFIHSSLIKDGIDVIAAAIGDDKEIIKSIYGRSFLDVSDLKNMPNQFAKIVKGKLLV